MKACDGVSLDGITRIVHGKYNYISRFWNLLITWTVTLKTKLNRCEFNNYN